MSSPATSGRRCKSRPMSGRTIDARTVQHRATRPGSKSLPGWRLLVCGQGVCSVRPAPVWAGQRVGRRGSHAITAALNAYVEGTT